MKQRLQYKVPSNKVQRGAPRQSVPPLEGVQPLVSVPPSEHCPKQTEPQLEEEEGEDEPKNQFNNGEKKEKVLDGTFLMNFLFSRVAV
jgi:hypothetical protein